MLIKNKKIKIVRNKKGVAVPFFALMLTAVIGLGALVIDVSQVYSLKARVKNAIDQAALAGISQLTNQSSVGSAKNVALQYLNNNLTSTIPSFTALTLGDNSLSLQGGIYDFSNMTFTWDEASSNINALMISYTYNSMAYLASIFMITSFNISDSVTVAKQPAGYMPPGGGFPMVIYSTALDDARVNNNMVDLYSSSSMDNSYWTDFTSSNPSTNDIKKVLDYFQYGMGTVPPGISINDTFRVNDGGMGGIYMDMDPSILVGMTYLFAVVTPTMSNEVMADGFVAGTINNIVDMGGPKYINITIIPGHIDNTWSGLTLGPSVTNINSNDQALLASGVGLVQ